MAEKKKKATEDGTATDAPKAEKPSKKKKAEAPEAAAQPAPVEAAPPPPPKTLSTKIKIPKLAPKHKSRLPRREKKAKKKAEAAERIKAGDRV
jgi:hypothetical protein